MSQVLPKTTAIRRTTVRETSVSRHHGGTIEGPPETPRTSVCLIPSPVSGTGHIYALYQISVFIPGRVSSLNDFRRIKLSVNAEVLRETESYRMHVQNCSCGD